MGKCEKGRMCALAQKQCEQEQGQTRQRRDRDKHWSGGYLSYREQRKKILEESLS